MDLEEELTEEIKELDELNEEPPLPLGEYVPDEEIFDLTELSDRLLGVTSLLNHIDQYKEDVSKKRRETDWKILDILHRLEDNIDNMTVYGFFKVIYELHHLRELRRTLKVSDTVIYEFQRNSNRLNNEGNRKMLDSTVCRELDKLTRPYRNRVYTEEQLNDMFTATELTDEEKEQMHNLLLQIEAMSLVNPPQKKRRGRPKKNTTSE